MTPMEHKDRKQADDFGEVLEALTEMVLQHCWSVSTRDDGVYESGAIGANADAMRLLAKHGVMSIEGTGRMVSGRLIGEPPL